MRVLALAPLLFVLSCGGEAPPEAGPPKAAVAAVPVVSASVQEQVSVRGRIRPLQTVGIVTRVTGELEEVAFEFGSRVDVGTRLFQIDPEPFEIAVAASQANVTSAEALWKQAEQYRIRLEEVREGGVPENDLQTARLEEQRLLAQLDAAKADLDRAQLDLSWATIEAPIAGLIGRTDLTTGDQVSPNSGTLVRINQIDPIEASFFVPEPVIVQADNLRRSQGLSREENDQQYSFELEIEEQVYEHRGSLSFRDAEIDTTTGTIEIRALFPNPDGVLIPNQTVEVLIDVGEPVERPVVPRIALLRDRSGETVLVAKADGTYERREVTLGPEIGRSVAVLDGIAEGDLVIIEGLDRIRPGTMLDVEVVDPGSVSAQPAAEGN